MRNGKVQGERKVVLHSSIMMGTSPVSPENPEHLVISVMKGDHIIYHPNRNTFKNERGCSYNCIRMMDVTGKVPGKLRHAVTVVRKLRLVPCLRPHD